MFDVDAIYRNADLIFSLLRQHTTPSMNEMTTVSLENIHACKRGHLETLLLGVIFQTPASVVRRYKPKVCRCVYKLHAVSHLKCLHQRLPVGFYGPHRQVEFICDLP